MKNNSFFNFFIVTLALLVMGSAAPAVSAEPIGSAVRIVNTVTGSLDQQQHNIAVGDGVSQNEAIEVAPDALGELKLRDDTKLALGPGSRLVLDKFVYDPSPSIGSVSVNLAKGAFRFITGQSRKGNYELRTPSASITVRGTIFDVYVDAAGGTWLLLLEGSVRVCNTANQCTDVGNPCGVVHVTPTGTLDGPQGWPAQTRPIDFATAFPFVVTPPSIDARPLFTRTAVETNQCAKPAKPQTREAEAPDLRPPQPKYTKQKPQQSYTPPPAALPLALARSFSGAYVGGNIGYGFSNSDANVGCVSPPLNFSFSANCYEAIAGGALVTSYLLKPQGMSGGLVAGYDIRLTNIVLGVASDFSKTDISGGQASATAVPTFVPEYGDAKQTVEWLGTLRGRLGFAADNLLMYATAGLAYGQVNTSYDLSLPGATPAVSAAVRTNDWEVGWTAGGGGEMSFGTFTVSAEYLFYDLGSRTVSPIAIRGGVPQPTTYFPTSFNMDGSIIRLGTNFPIN
jgi:opacity protein-like surface antigen